MKTILFCASTLLFSAIAMGQASLKSQQSAKAVSSVSKNNEGIQGSGAVTATSQTQAEVNPKPIVEASGEAAVRAKTKVSKRSRATAKAAVSEVEDASPQVSVRANNKTRAAASINGEQNISTDVPAMKQKKGRVRANSNISTNSSIHSNNIQASGLIRTGVGIGL